MLVFVDFVGMNECYRDASGPSWVHPNMPLEVITGGAFLDAAVGAKGTKAFVYHVERGEYLASSRLCETTVSPLDTLIVVACGQAAVREPQLLDAMWSRHGGAFRRLEHAGMPASARDALIRYAQ